MARNNPSVFGGVLTEHEFLEAHLPEHPEQSSMLREVLELIIVFGTITRVDKFALLFLPFFQMCGLKAALTCLTIFSRYFEALSGCFLPTSTACCKRGETSNLQKSPNASTTLQSNGLREALTMVKLLTFAAHSSAGLPKSACRS